MLAVEGRLWILVGEGEREGVGCGTRTQEVCSGVVGIRWVCLERLAEGADM